MSKKFRTAIIVENAKDSGGNRVIFKRAAALAAGGEDEVTILVTARKIRTLKDVAGQIRDIIACKLWYRFAAAVRLQRGLVDFERFDRVISTGRGPLNFVGQLGDPRHVHLIQHIEAWTTLNSEPFLKFCETERYPTSTDCVELVRQGWCESDVLYLGKLAQIKRFETVSNFLRAILETLGTGKEILVSEPPEISDSPPPENSDVTPKQRDIDVLFFVRGFPFKGDSLSVAVINALAETPYRVAVIAGLRTSRILKSVSHRSRLEVISVPSNEEVADMYSRAKIVVNPSLCEGFGAIPREGLAFGCHVIASRTGWLQDQTCTSDKLTVIDRHDVALYVSAIKRVLS